MRITVTARRTAPLVVWVSATAASAPGGAASPLSAQAMHARVVGLMAPAWPIGAAAVSNVPLDSSNARRIGAAIPERGQCPDTGGADVPAGLMVRGALLRSALAESWPVVERRAGRWRADAPDDGRWRAAAMAPADSVLVGNHRWTGLVLHDGPLRIVGALTVHGLLVVRGPVDARDGRLSVRGAMLIDAPPASEVRLGPAEIQWDRCAISMALATVADLRSAPFFAWWAVTP